MVVVELESSELFSVRLTVMLLTPRLCIESLMEPVSESPTVTMAMTEPMPMMMPSIVKMARILLAHRLANAI